jgi:hypothetical protein
MLSSVDHHFVYCCILGDSAGERECFNELRPGSNNTYNP